MQQIEFVVSPKRDLAKADLLIERVCATHGLQAAMKGTLAAYPGSIHWHYKKPHEKGTLELTLWRRDRRIWAAVHTNRKAPWIERVLLQIRADVEQALDSAGDRS